MAPLKVLEFYSGIGGMHYAAQLAGWDYEILQAFDINDVANDIYKHNFEKKLVSQKLIEAMNIDYYDNFKADVWTMSPPCQPYTRIGLQQGSQDTRSKSFLHLLTVLDHMKHPPNYILVENVKGFEVSDSRDMLVRQLIKSQYHFQEFLLTPLQLGIPNSRLRYYLLAKLKSSSSSSFSFHTTNPSTLEQPVILDHIPTLIPSLSEALANNTTKQISDYLDPSISLTNDNSSEYAIPDKTLLKHCYVFDIVKPSSYSSCCFTKGYYHFAQATGSILQMNEDADASQILDQINELKKEQNKDQEMLKLLYTLQLRYFTPHEVAKLMGFPKEFTFPEKTTKKQQYRTLGNSINVTLVSCLMKYLIM
ncbi:S-adenosyl-L-methionine-dependent methyltransferase [Cunninghamella echinulata]|nr:S-adenosyl-L-methionine-dependent methyltransferase [Cunninghamella echinulata]